MDERKKHLEPAPKIKIEVLRSFEGENWTKIFDADGAVYISGGDRCDIPRQKLIEIFLAAKKRYAKNHKTPAGIPNEIPK